MRAELRAVQGARPRMALDLDGCFCNLLQKAVERCGIPLPFNGYEDAPGYSIRSWGLNRDQIRAIAGALYDPQTCVEAEPYEGAVDAWRVLERLGSLYVVTARADRYRHQTVDWLARHQLGAEDVIFSSDKAAVAQELGITIAFDDSPKNLVAYWNAGITAFKPDYPFNRTAPGIPYSSWADLFSHEPLASLLEAAIREEGSVA